MGEGSILFRSRCLQQLYRPRHAGSSLQQPCGMSSAQPGVGSVRSVEPQHRGATNEMIGTGHVGMARHASALDEGWQFPASGCTKVNIDGSCERLRGHATYGGVIHDASGQWKLRFYKYIGVCSILESELRGVYVGLGCALEKGFRKIVIEMNCSEDTRLLLKTSDRLVSMSILFHIRDLVRQKLEDVGLKLIRQRNT
ncbi:hypothetical protein V6N13_080909 [Hibiscus sabdariffa]|uniref:RNase H type-1 domain-containing protein n=2 Tax=Hibiscus sabdariffa TaxID=183260 RepID=A0ABR2CBZ6_9ROSI